MSSAEVFRTRQAVRDLVDAVGLHREAVQRLGLSGADKDTISRITADGRIDADDRQDAFSTILLAAAMPDDDFGAFVGATLLLLADKLQSGGNAEDLSNNWDAFHEHYLLADPPIRAALMNGFRLLDDRDLVNLSNPPSFESCTTFSRGDVIATLQAVGMHELYEAVRDDIPASDAGALWQHKAGHPQVWQSLVGFRYLYERPTSMSPPTPQDAPLIPWV